MNRIIDMPKYYNEAAKNASLKYRRKNVDQINVTGLNIKALFKEQAGKHGIAVNRYLIDMVQDDADGNLVRIPFIEKGDVPGVIRSLAGTAVAPEDAQKILEKMDEKTRKAVRITAADGLTTEQAVIMFLISAFGNEAAAGNAEMFMRCLEANGADRTALTAIISEYPAGKAGSQNI